MPNDVNGIALAATYEVRKLALAWGDWAGEDSGKVFRVLKASCELARLQTNAAWAKRFAALEDEYKARIDQANGRIDALERRLEE